MKKVENISKKRPGLDHFEQLCSEGSMVILLHDFRVIMLVSDIIIICVKNLDVTYCAESIRYFFVLLLFR